MPTQTITTPTRRASAKTANTAGLTLRHREESLSETKLARTAMLHIIITTSLEQSESALDSLPPLNAEHEYEDRAERQSPFPSNACVLEDTGVEVGNVDGGENRHGTDHDRPEEEFILVNILEEWEATIGHGVEAEHATAEGLEFPGRDKDEPCQFCEDGGTGTEHGVARSFGIVVVSCVTFVAEVAVVGTVDDNDEGEDRAGSHDDSVDDHIDHDLRSENSPLDLVRRTLHNLGAGLLTTKTESREGGGGGGHY